jgi:fumarate hydratase class II
MPAGATVRIESDSMGPIEVPVDRYWGAQTQRALQHFAIGDHRMPGEVIHALAAVKEAAAHVNQRRGRLAPDYAGAIAAASAEVRAGALDDHFPLSIYQTGSGTQTNMNVNEVVANRAAEILGHSRGDRLIHPNDHVNLSQSSNDTFPTAMAIAATIAIEDRVLPALDALHDTLVVRAGAWDDLVKIGRTHLMDATPLTLGQEVSGWAAQLAAGRAAVIGVMGAVRELAIGGTAVGTGLNAPEGWADDLVGELSTVLGRSFVPAPNKFAALGSHDALVAASAALRGLAAALIKIGNDVRLLASGPRCGLGELILPANEPGSSIMPGKVNPTQVEALTMVCARVIGNDAAIVLAQTHGHLQLNTWKPLMIASFLESARLLGDAMASFRRHCVDGIEPNRPRIAELVNRSLMLVTALTPVIGYDAAATAAKLAHERGVTLREAVLELKLMSADAFDRAVRPETMVGRRVTPA